MIIQLSSIHDAKRLIARAILVKEIIALWADAPNLPDLLRVVKCESTHFYPDYMDSSFKFHVEGYNKSITIEQQIEIIDQFEFLPFRGSKLDSFNISTLILL